MKTSSKIAPLVGCTAQPQLNADLDHEEQALYTANNQSKTKGMSTLQKNENVSKSFLNHLHSNVP